MLPAGIWKVQGSSILIHPHLHSHVQGPRPEMGPLPQASHSHRHALVSRAARLVSKTVGAHPKAESSALTFSLAHLKKKKVPRPPLQPLPAAPSLSRHSCSLSSVHCQAHILSPPHADALWTLGLNGIPLPQKAQQPTWSCYVETELLSLSRGKARGKTGAVIPAFPSYQLSGNSLTSSIKTQGSLFSTFWASTVYWAVSWVLGRQCEPTDMVPVLTGTGRMGSGRRRHSQEPASGLQFEL